MRGTYTALIFKTENQTMKKTKLIISLIAVFAIAAVAAPTATFVATGNSVDYTPSADVAAGDVVVQVSLLGIATSNISANDLGALAVSGVFDVPSDSVAIPAGTQLYWDAASEIATATASNYVAIGYAVAVTTTNDAVVRVLIK